MFPKQAANSLVTETSQYFVFFCRYVCSAILAKCLIINVLRLILVILFFYCISKYYLCSPSHFRDYDHACQQCASSRCFRHARPCLHTYDTALCTGHEQQPERSNGQREETPRMVNIQPTVIEGIWKGYLLFLDCLLSTYLPKNNCFNLDLYY